MEPMYIYAPLFTTKQSQPSTHDKKMADAETPKEGDNNYTKLTKHEQESDHNEIDHNMSCHA